MAKKPMIILCKINGRETELPCSASGCPLFGDCLVRYEKYAHRKQTNADRIRAMSDEELYKFCLSLTDDGWPFACQNKPECDPVPPKPELCNECFMKWLQQPAEVE